jgi:hypothetical protein
MLMPSARSIFVATAVLLSAAASPGQDGPPGVRTSVALHAGYAAASGGWTDHPYAPVPFFRQDLVIGGEVAFPLTDKLALAVNGGYSALNTGEWDRYARSMGDAVTSSASLGYIAVVIRPYLKHTAPDLVSLDIGPLLLFPSGSERIGARSYHYDFMSSPRIGGMAAVEYDRCVGESYSAYVRLAAIYVPSALQYADGWSPAFVSLPLTLGMRFLF